MSVFRCWVPDFPDLDRLDVNAHDSWAAAKRFAQIIDDESGAHISDGALSSGAGLRVHVQSADGVETVWKVWPEAIVRWYACAAPPEGE